MRCGLLWCGLEWFGVEFAKTCSMKVVFVVCDELIITILLLFFFSVLRCYMMCVFKGVCSECVCVCAVDGYMTEMISTPLSLLLLLLLLLVVVSDPAGLPGLI